MVKSWTFLYGTSKWCEQRRRKNKVKYLRMLITWSRMGLVCESVIVCVACVCVFVYIKIKCCNMVIQMLLLLFVCDFFLFVSPVEVSLLRSALQKCGWLAACEAIFVYSSRNSRSLLTEFRRAAVLLFVVAQSWFVCWFFFSAHPLSFFLSFFIMLIAFCLPLDSFVLLHCFCLHKSKEEHIVPMNGTCML